MSSQYISPPTSSEKVANDDEDGSFHTAPETPVNQRTGKVVPSSSPQFTPIDLPEDRRTEVDETPTRSRKRRGRRRISRARVVADDEDEINLIQRSAPRRPSNAVVANSQWWEEEPPGRVDDEDVEVVLNTETEYDDDVDIIRDSFGNDSPSAQRLVKKPRTSGILTLLND